MDNKNKFQDLYGYEPPLKERIFKYLLKILLFLLRINGKNKFSNWILEEVNPFILVKSKIDNSIKFKWITGHNRLLWRAKTFDTEESLMVRWLSKFKKDDNFLDIGANCGIYTLAAACKCDNICAVELDPINIGILKENLVLNNFEEKVLIIPFAAGESNKKELIFFRSCSKSDAFQTIGKPSSLGTRLYEGNHKTPQLLFSLDFIFKEFKLKSPNKIKIDVDGNEKVVFKGAERIILNAEEIYYEDSGFAESKKVLAKLLDNGFKILKEEKPNKTIRGRNLLLKNSNI
tara:strand:- start:2567 stop:3433 length:867 start_codon:yes stop_codon:yes gene_type:complete